MPDKKNNRVNTYVSVTAVFCGLVAIISATDPFPALRTPILIGSVVVLMTMAFLLGKEARAPKNPKGEPERQG